VSTETKEIIAICEALPPEKQSAVAEFARFLLSREDDQRWERLLSHPSRRAKLDAFVRESASEPDEPMDLNRL
jgi:hypothetical protein